MVLGLLKHFYDKNYKALLFATLIIYALSVGFLLTKYAVTGAFIEKSVSLKGGLTLTIPVTQEYSISAVEKQLKKNYPKTDTIVRELGDAGRITSLIIETSDLTEEQVKTALTGIGLTLKPDSYTKEFIGSSLGQSFFRQIIIAIIIAFVAMAVAVLITFKNLLPSFFVVLAASGDIISTLAVISLLGMKLTTAGIASFLMLIGYSVDTDILLTTRVLKRKEGTVFERILNAMQTGTVMSVTSILAVSVALIITQSDLIKQIMIILLIGLLFDFIYTWGQNANILRWYLKEKDV